MNQKTELEIPSQTCLHRTRAWLGLAVGAWFAWAGTVGAQAQNPRVATDWAVYAVGQDIVVTFANGPANPKDWLGIYPQGITPGSQDSTRWSYADGTTQGTTGLTEGTVTFAGGLSTPGKWVVHFLLNDGYQSLASQAFEVRAPGDMPKIIPQFSAYYPGENIRMLFENGPGNPKDWIGIYPEGDEPGSVASFRWLYVDGTTAGNVGYREGAVNFPGWLSLGGVWDVYLLLNDAYGKLAKTSLTIVDPSTPLVRMDKRDYQVGEKITVSFFAGPGNARDWIGIYKAGETPGGGPSSTLWAYVDGSQTGSTGLAEGQIEFATGLTATGNYVAFFLMNDGYDVLASETFTVTAAADKPRILSIQPADGSQNLPAQVSYLASITNGTSKVVTSTIALTLDGQTVAHSLVQQGELLTVSYRNETLFAPGSTHRYRLAFSDDATPAQQYTAEATVTVANYRNIVLPAPLYFENFDATPEGQLPAGWTEESYTDVSNSSPDFDLGNLDSASYATWTVVAADRFKGTFVTYSNPDGPQAEKEDYHRVLSVNPLNVVNGVVLDTPLATGRFLFGDSGYRNGASQVLFAYTPDYDLTGRKDVHVAFYSLWEQNQDSIAALEYSTDQGQTWLPVVYLLATSDIVTLTNPDTGATEVDAVATLTTERPDIARYFDPDSGEEKGGTYGAFIAAPISQALAPYLSGRIDDDPVESKRVELFRLAAADGQAKVRFRFAHAGTDSWYWGIDNFGLYSIPSTPAQPPTLALSRSANGVVLSWPADAIGYSLVATASLTNPNWQPVPGVTGNSFTVTTSEPAQFYQLVK